MCVCACACVCVCVCVCVFGCVSLHTQINHEPSSFWSVISTGGAERAAPGVLQGPLPSQSSSLPPLLVGLFALWPWSSSSPILRWYWKEGGREGKGKGRKKEGREGRREDSSNEPHRRRHESEELNFLTLTLCTAHSLAPKLTSLVKQNQKAKSSSRLLAGCRALSLVLGTPPPTL